MSIFSLWRRKPTAPATIKVKPWTPQTPPQAGELDVRRHFYNEPGFQCYTSFFAFWDGWITAGHCLTEAQHILPPFAKGSTETWPEGLDAALVGCTLPAERPPALINGRHVICKGYPAGAQAIETRRGHIYIERGAGSGTWIAHITQPDEPVVTGMSGGPVIDVKSGEPVGIIITRNSPADLNNDLIPDQSFDFISLRAVWDAVTKMQNIA